MHRWFEVSSFGDWVRLTVAYTLAAIVASLGIGEIFATVVGQQNGLNHYLLSVGIPLLIAPVVAGTLLGMNRRLNLLRSEMDVLARTDPMTGLPNRRAFFKRANEIFALLQGHEPAAVLMIDVDHFKKVNDTFGHAAGDAVLRTVAETIVAVSAEHGAHRALAARVGGEEFAVVIDGFNRTETTALAEAICDRVRRAVTVHQTASIQVTVSVGAALREDVDAIDVVLKKADCAVYEAKESGRDRWCFASSGAPARRGIVRQLRGRPQAA